jgi:hypothetical protein
MDTQGSSILISMYNNDEQDTDEELNSDRFAKIKMKYRKMDSEERLSK